jgi:hypothetical protein
MRSRKSNGLNPISTIKLLPLHLLQKDFKKYKCSNEHTNGARNLSLDICSTPNYLLEVHSPSE